MDKDDLTQKGKQAILHGGEVILRTSLARSSESVKELSVPFTSLDSLYENSRSFTTLNKKLARAVLEKAKNGDVVYCVDGSPVEDNSVKLLEKKKGVTIIDGVSKGAHFATLAKISSSSYAAFSAYDILEYKRRTLPLIVYDIDSDFLAGDVKLYLADLVGEEKKVKFFCEGKSKTIPLYELDRQKKYNYTTAIVVEEEPLVSRKRFDFVDLCEILTRLRRPDGCPWDKVQTPESMKMSPVEEAYELLEAVNLKDDDKILEETGDLLFLTAFYAVMKEEDGAFNASDLLSSECEKMISRHTHIFGKDEANSEEAVLSLWEKNKMKEKHQTTFSAAVNDVPTTFPALLRAAKVDKRMQKGGWKEGQEEIVNKIHEELSEVLSAIQKNDPSETKEEVGDFLLAAVRLAVFAGVNAEEALLDAVGKVKKRFEQYETLVLADGKEMNELTKEEKNEYYLRAKELCK